MITGVFSEVLGDRTLLQTDEASKPCIPHAPILQINENIRAWIGLRVLRCCRSVLGLAPGAAAVVTNGRLVPLPDAEPLVAEDFDLLALYANSAQVARQVGRSPAVSGAPWVSLCDHDMKTPVVFSSIACAAGVYHSGGRLHILST